MVSPFTTSASTCEKVPPAIVMIVPLKSIFLLSAAKALGIAFEVVGRFLRSMSRVSQWANWAEPGSQEWHIVVGTMTDDSEAAKSSRQFVKMVIVINYWH